jgi:hypothetical protein
MSLSAVTNQFSLAFQHVIQATVNAGTLVANTASNASSWVVGSITPKLAAVVEKIQSLNPPTFMEKAWGAATSRTGLTAIFTTVAVTSLVYSQCTDNTIHKVALIAVGLTTLALGAYTATMPFGVARA